MKRHIRAGIPQYTYRQAHTEEKVIYRRLAIIGGLTLVIILIIWFWGTTFVRIIGALGSKSIDEEPQTTLMLPLLKPSIPSLPEITNEEKITISGTTTANVSVTLTVNGVKAAKTLSDSNGSFSFVDVSLREGQNLVKVLASDSSGESQATKKFVTFDNTSPDLKVISPVNNQSFDKKTEEVTIKGSSEPDASVYVNSIQTILDKDGGFSYVLSVTAGENKIEVKVIDKAGNKKVKKLTITVAK